MRSARQKLIDIIQEDCAGPVPGDLTLYKDRILNRAPNTAAILYYGSGLWAGADADTVHDFYVLVDDYGDFDNRTVARFLGPVLPPNVYFEEFETATTTLRAKITVIKLDQFCAQAAGKAFTPQIWARFAQPCRLVFTRDEATKGRVHNALGDAVMTFHDYTAPLMEGWFQPQELWVEGLRRSYATEWRGERESRARAIVKSDPESFEKRTRRALPLSRWDLTQQEDGSIIGHIPGWRHYMALALSPLRRWRARAITFARLLKATWTFEGAVDYALWKIERQSGIRLEASDFQRRHPLIGCWPLLWKALRKRAIR